MSAKTDPYSFQPTHGEETHFDQIRQMKQLAAEMKAEAKRSRPDNEKLSRLADEFYSAEADLLVEQAAQRQRLLDRIGPDGRPAKVQRGATTRDLDDDPFGEPRSIEAAPRFANPWQVFENVNDLRSASPSDVWHGVASTAVGWSWDAEAEQVSDDATTYAGPQIPIHTARGFVPISLEAIQDAANVARRWAASSPSARTCSNRRRSPPAPGRVNPPA